MRAFQHVPSGPIVCGPGVAATIGGQGPLKKAQRVLVVTDTGVRSAGLWDRIAPSVGARVALLEDGVVQDGDCAFVDAAAGRARELDVDAVLAVGGGSVLDTAKGIAAVLATGKSIAQLEGYATIRTRLLPIVAVPTTSGTGSEATQFAVLKDHAAGRKRIYVDASLVPAQAVLDPELCLGLPRAVTAATGVDAITHAVEALCSRMAHPIGSALALQALQMLVVDGALQRALATPDDVDARGACLVAANLAGQAVSTSMLGACHALAHGLGAVVGVPHGVANGVCLLAVLRANAPRVPDAWQRMSSLLGGDPVVVLDRVIHDVAGVPRTLAALGVQRAQLPTIAAIAVADPDLPTNPLKLDEPALLALLQSLFDDDQTEGRDVARVG